MKKHEIKITPSSSTLPVNSKEGGIGVKVEIDSNYTRINAIKNCKKCGGEPKLEPIKLNGFVGEKCADCLLVKSWEKAGKQLKIE